MSEFNLKTRLLASSVFAGAALAAVAALPAYAQDADEVIAVETAGEDEEAVQQTIVVTGSLIPQSGNLVETSPVTSLGSADFDVRGVVRAEDMINSLPQAFGAQGSNLANGSTGTSSVNLRGLGASRTLTLLNGRRLPYGSAAKRRTPQLLRPPVPPPVACPAAGYTRHTLGVRASFRA